MKYPNLLISSAISLVLGACGGGNDSQTQAQKDRLSTVTSDGTPGQRTQIKTNGTLLSNSSATAATSGSTSPSQLSSVTFEEAFQPTLDAAWKVAEKYNFPQIEIEKKRLQDELYDEGNPPTSERRKAIITQLSTLSLSEEGEEKLYLDVEAAVKPFFETEFINFIANRKAEYEGFNVAGDLAVPSNPNRPWQDMINLKTLVNRFEPGKLNEEVYDRIRKIEAIVEAKPQEQQGFFRRVLGIGESEVNTALSEYSDFVRSVSKDSHQPEHLISLEMKISSAFSERMQETLSNQLYWANLTKAVIPQLEGKFVLSHTFNDPKSLSGMQQEVLKSLVGTLPEQKVFKSDRQLSIPQEIFDIRYKYYRTFFIKGQLLQRLNAISSSNADGVYALKPEVDRSDIKFIVQPLELQSEETADGEDTGVKVYAPKGPSITTIDQKTYDQIQGELVKILIGAMKQSYRGWKTMIRRNAGSEERPWWEYEPAVDQDNNPIVGEINPFAGLFDGIVFDDTLPTAAALSAGIPSTLTSGLSRAARTNASAGELDFRGVTMKNGFNQQVQLNLPIHIALKGNLSESKSTEELSGTVAYTLGKTSIGLNTGYANAGNGFEWGGKHTETNALLSQSWQTFFVEGQIGAVSVENLYDSAWVGSQTRLKLGIDMPANVSPFVQLQYRTFDRDQLFSLNNTIISLGIELDIIRQSFDTYTISTQLITQAGFNYQDWSKGSKSLGSTHRVDGSLDWSGSLNLNSGVTFNSTLKLGLLSGSSAAFNVSFEQ